MKSENVAAGKKREMNSGKDPSRKEKPVKGGESYPAQKSASGKKPGEGIPTEDMKSKLEALKGKFK